MTFKLINESKPQESKVVILLYVNNDGKYDILPGYLKDNQYFYPDSYPFVDEFRPVAWHDLPELPVDCTYTWQ